MKQQEYPARDNSCGLARTRNLAVWMEHPTAECGTATGGSRPTAANGKFPRGSEDKKPNAFRRWVVHCNCYKSLGITSCGGLRTHPGDNHFDSAVKAGLMVCLKHKVIDRWCTDGSENSEEWLLAKQLAEKIGLNTELYRPLTEMGKNGFMWDLANEK